MTPTMLHAAKRFAGALTTTSLLIAGCWTAPLLAQGLKSSLAQQLVPRVGEPAPNFSLSSPEGKDIQLSSLLAQGAVVLVVLRGFPGYQCPLCNRQVQDFVRNGPQFAAAKTHVLFVYPGPRGGLAGKASEFLTDKKLPEHFTLVLDPDYEFTNRYGLRWEAPNETAYPSAFVLDTNGRVVYAMTSKSHGGRASAAQVLEALAKRSRAQQ